VSLSNCWVEGRRCATLSLEPVFSEDKIDFASIAANELRLSEGVKVDKFRPRGGIHKPNGWIQQSRCLYLFPLSVRRNPPSFCFSPPKKLTRILYHKMFCGANIFPKAKTWFFSWHPTNQPPMYVWNKTISVPLGPLFQKVYYSN